MRVVVKLNFLQCYKILGITEECDWVTFRKNYKSLIQQHHPDRFSENTPEHANSEKAIRYYNAAYKTIFDFYQLNKSLPPRNEDSFNLENQEPTQRKKRPPVSQPEFKAKAQPKTRFIKPVIISTILTSALAIFVYNLSPEEEKQITPTESVKNIIKIDTDNKDTNKRVTQSEDNTTEQYYSIGSSLGEVIVLEGKPNHIIETTWYYGKSSITFTNGTVSGWSRHPDNPLKIRINQPAPFNFNQADKAATTNTKKPYWQK